MVMRQRLVAPKFALPMCHASRFHHLSLGPWQLLKFKDCRQETRSPSRAQQLQPVLTAVILPWSRHQEVQQEVIPLSEMQQAATA